MEFVIDKFAKLMGWCIVICFGLALCSYVLKFINKKYGKSLREHKSLGKYYTFLFKHVIKYHKAFAFSTILFLGIHFIIFFSARGLNLKGAIAAVLMILIILQGCYGSLIMKKRNKAWLHLHRTLSILLIFAILLHVL